MSKTDNKKRLIDANELTDRLNHTTMVAYPNLFPGLLAAIDVVDDSPTVDAVEVVRCKDCKHFVAPQGVPCCDNFYGLGFPNASGNDFCSYGERRSNE